MVSNIHRLLLRKGRNNRSNSDFQTFFEEFINENTNIEKIYVYASERSKRAKISFAFSHSKPTIFKNILLVLQILCRYTWQCFSAYMYRQISKCTDKTPKKHYWGSCPPCPPVTTLVPTQAPLFGNIVFLRNAPTTP